MGIETGALVRGQHGYVLEEARQRNACADGLLPFPNDIPVDHEYSSGHWPNLERSRHMSLHFPTPNPSLVCDCEAERGPRQQLLPQDGDLREFLRVQENCGRRYRCLCRDHILS